MGTSLRKLRDTDVHNPGLTRSASSMAVFCKEQRKVDHIFQCEDTPMYSFPRTAHKAPYKAWRTLEWAQRTSHGDEQG